MQRLSLLSACIFALFLASCGGSSGGSVDTDSDGVPDSKDLCKNSLDENFISDDTTDADKDGCEDSTEDQDGGDGSDEDNDGKVGDDDKCPQGDTNWTSISTSTDPAVTITDYDGDGCRDAGEDTDDDNDTILDVTDVDDDNDGLIEIATAEELNNIRHDLDGTHYDDELADTDTGDEGSNAGCPTTTTPVGCNGYELANDISLASIINWVPISAVSALFTATLEGNDYTISNLVIATDATTQYTGFFRTLGANSIVKNLSLKGSVTSSYITGHNTNPNFVGGLAGSNGGTISGVSAGVSVSAGTGNSDYVGGLVGNNDTTGTIQNSYATGSIAGGEGGDAVGGLAGYSNGTIQNSYATGPVSGGADGDYVGGLVGDIASGTIQNSYSLSTVSGDGGDDYVGGLVGDIASGTIQNSYSLSTVSGDGGDDSVGGLVGDIASGTIQNSYSLSTVSGDGGDDSVGGLVGDIASGTIQNSYALGDVNGGTGDDNVGRLVGKKMSSVTITSNYFDGGSTLSVVANEDTELTLLGTEAVGKTSDQLKAINLDPPDNQDGCEAAGGTWDDTASSCTSGNLAGWNAFNWEFQAGFYPTLKSYETTTDTSTPPVITQIAGTLLCGQLPEADFVQCPTPTP